LDEVEYMQTGFAFCRSVDEATSALDQENEKRILKAIGDLQSQLSIFLIIAHRFSTINKPAACGADPSFVFHFFQCPRHSFPGYARRRSQITMSQTQFEHQAFIDLAAVAFN
jgi:hypothetical protein